MPQRGPFPTPDADFNSYVNAAVPYLEVNRVRLNVTIANVNTATVQKNSWNTLFAASQNNATRTSAITADKNNVRTQLENQLRLIYADIAESALTETDRATLHLPKRDTVPSPRPHIETQPYAEMQPLGGGRIKITLRVQNDGSRASMHPDADSVEMAYTIGSEVPISPEACNNHITYKGSIETKDFGVANETKRLFAYFRWKNDSDETKSSPWSNLQQVVIA